MKKVVVISTSLRPGSSSHSLAERFAEGARAAGNEVELISLRGKLLPGDKNGIFGGQNPDAGTSYGRSDEHAPSAFVVAGFDIALFLQAGKQALDGGFIDAELFAETVNRY